MLNFVKQPFIKHGGNDSWNHYVVNKDRNYHMKNILNQGRADFTANYQEKDSSLVLSNVDMEILYRYYYFQFHYTSSLYIYELGMNTLRTLIENCQVAFIDIGCGPFTSGVAFKEFCVAQGITTTINYYGYDIAQVMMNSGMTIAQYSNDVHFTTQNDFHLDYNSLQQLIISDEKVIIVNICYFLSAYKLNINEFLDTIEAFFNRNVGNQILIIYQNPEGLNRNWKLFKQRFKSFRTLKIDNSSLSVAFDAVKGTWAYANPVKRKVYYDCLTNLN